MIGSNVQNRSRCGNPTFTICFIIALGMLRERPKHKVGEWDLNIYLRQRIRLVLLSSLNAEEFYEKGPSFADGHGVTYNIAKPLLKTCQTENGRCCERPSSGKHVAKLSFCPRRTNYAIGGLLHVEASQKSAAPDELFIKPKQNNVMAWRLVTALTLRTFMGICLKSKKPNSLRW